MIYVSVEGDPVTVYEVAEAVYYVVLPDETINSDSAVAVLVEGYEESVE